MTGDRNHLGNYLQNAYKMKAVVTITHGKRKEAPSRRLQQALKRRSSAGATTAPSSRSALCSVFKGNIPRELAEGV